MTNQALELKFLDYLDGTLSEGEKIAFEEALVSDAELNNSFEAYKKIIEMEQELSAKSHALSPNFVVKVMDEVEGKEIGFLRRMSMYLTRNQKVLGASLATCATLLVVIKLNTNAPEDFKLPHAELEVAQKSELGPVVAREISPLKGGTKEVHSSSSDSISRGRDEEREDLKQNFGVPANEAMDSLGIDPNVAVPKTAEERQNPSVQPKALTSAYATQGEWKDKDLLKKFSERQHLMIASTAGGIAYSSESEIAALPPAPCDTCVIPWSPGNTEQYLSYSENQRIMVADEALSTFSIDVDTGSYTNARRFLQAGQLPPTDSVRIEEFVNYFSYNYPVQREKPFTLSYEAAPAPLDKNHFLLKLGIKARDPQPSEKPWNLVFLIDVSGSMMDASKLELIKRSMPLMVNSMRPEDRIAIVTYAGNAGLVLDSTTVKDKQKILSAIETLNAGGSTNGSGGIKLAYEIAEKNKISGAVNRVVLATDGDFNVGVTSHDELVKMIEEKRKSGITLTTLGFGTGNLKDGTMEQLANKGNGNYFYIDSFKEARKVLQDNLAGNMEVVAKDVKLQIEFNPEHVAQYRLIGYDNRRLKKEEFNDDKIDAGEIGAGHTVTALYEIVLADSEIAKQLETEYRYQKKTEAKKVEATKEKTSELAFLKIRYKEPEGSTSSLLQYPIEKKEVKQDLKSTSDDFRFAAAVAYFGTLLRESQFKGEYTLADIEKLAAEARGSDENGYRQEFIELVKNAASIKR